MAAFLRWYFRSDITSGYTRHGKTASRVFHVDLQRALGRHTFLWESSRKCCRQAKYLDIHKKKTTAYEVEFLGP